MFPEETYYGICERPAARHLPAIRSKSTYSMPTGQLCREKRNWVSNNFMNLRMRPGDTIFVPEKIIGASTVWQNIAAVAQAMAAALPIAIAGSY